MNEKDLFCIISNLNQTGISIEIDSKKNTANITESIYLPFLREKDIDSDIFIATLYSMVTNLKIVTGIDLSTIFLIKNKVEYQINFKRFEDDGLSCINFSGKELNLDLVKELNKMPGLNCGRLNDLIPSINKVLSSAKKPLTYHERDNDFIINEKFSNGKIKKYPEELSMLISGFFMMFKYDEIIIMDSSKKYYYFSKGMADFSYKISEGFENKGMDYSSLISIFEKESGKNDNFKEAFLATSSAELEKALNEKKPSKEHLFNFLLFLMKMQEKYDLSLQFKNKYNFIIKKNGLFKEIIFNFSIKIETKLKNIIFVFETDKSINDNGKIIKNIAQINNKLIPNENLRLWLVILKDKIIIEEIDANGKIRTENPENYEKIIEFEGIEIEDSYVNYFIDEENIERINLLINLGCKKEALECLKIIDKPERIEETATLLILKYSYNEQNYAKYIQCLEGIENINASKKNRDIFLAESKFLEIMKASVAGESAALEIQSINSILISMEEFYSYSRPLYEGYYLGRADALQKKREELKEYFYKKIKSIFAGKTGIEDIAGLNIKSARILIEALAEKYLYTEKSYPKYMEIINFCKKKIGDSCDEKTLKIFLYEDTFYRLNKKYYPIGYENLLRLKKLDSERVFRLFREAEINRLIKEWALGYDYSISSYDDYKKIIRMDLGNHSFDNDFFSNDENFFNAVINNSILPLKKLSKKYYSMKSKKINSFLINSIKILFKENSVYEDFSGLEIIKFSNEDKSALNEIITEAKKNVYKQFLKSDLVFEGELESSKKLAINLYFLGKKFGIKINVFEEDFGQDFQIIYGNFLKLLQNEPVSPKEKYDKILMQILNDRKEDYKNYFENYLNSLGFDNISGIIIFIKKMRSLFNKIIRKSFGYESLSENFILDLSGKINQFIKEYKIVTIKSFLNGYIDLVEKRYHSYKQHFEKAYNYIENLNKIYSLINESENGLKKMQDFLNSRGSSFEALMPTERLSATINSLIRGENIAKFKVLDENDSVLGPLYKSSPAINYNKALNECFKGKSGTRKKIEKIERNIFGSIYFNNIVKKTIEKLKI